MREGDVLVSPHRRKSRALAAAAFDAPIQNKRSGEFYPNLDSLSGRAAGVEGRTCTKALADAE